ncbi:unnamed protein product [Vitrella brassicaformis CCMP3155]|uniref:Potassium channel tetramerisation-type BTB domain-containing protein n=1 Tax=Vitrella brassicaformis (strain CCMP3155) TaxID=1169540 RepID=A0A0G4H263_VITBC|nr:unnamed protein product [Vitrella brassicaformis CCMP3155]|eukprot:CEM37626.1 unnamed protein product [Vitrella brassicaformis CCMP3155]
MASIHHLEDMAASAAAAAAAAGEKRKYPDHGVAGESASLGALHQSIQYSRSVTDALQAMLDELEERERAMGGSAVPNKPKDELMKEVLELNVSGEHVRVQRSTLCAVVDSVLATLFCGKFDAAFIRDDSNRIFLNIFPPAFQWCVMHLIMYEDERISNMSIPPSKQHDTPFTYWVELLLWDPAYKRRPRGDPVLPAADPATDQQEDSEQPTPAPLRLNAELHTLMKKAVQEKAAHEQRLDAIKPLLKADSVEDDTVRRTRNSRGKTLVSASVSGSTVTVTTGVAKSLGDDSTFANRFLKYGPTVRAPIEHVRRIVDVVARAHMKKGAAITAADVQGAMGELDIEGYRHALTMYGLDSDRYLGPADGLLTTDHLHKMRQWCEGRRNVPAHIPSCVGEPVIRIYKATKDGWKWLDFFDAVKGHSPLLLISKVADSNELFALIIEGPIEVTETAMSHLDTRSHSFKLRGTDSHPHVGHIGWGSKMLMAGTQERVTNLIDFSSPASNMTAVLAASCLDFAVRPAAQAIGAAAAASDETMRRCQGVMIEEGQTDEWQQWQRPSARPSDYGGVDGRASLPVSVKGWHFEIGELEAYQLA